MIRSIIEKLFWRHHREDLENVTGDSEKLNELFEQFRGNEDFIELFRMLAKGDKEGIIKSIDNPRAQLLYRGQYLRSLYVIKKARIEKVGDKGTFSRFGSGRYAKGE